MTGLEKMQSQILDEAHRSADEILEQARNEAQERKEEAKRAAGKKQPYSGKIQDRGGAY